MKLRVISCALIALACACSAAAEDRLVTVLTVSRTIDPISARYILRGLDRARRDGAALAVIELDTPGGLGSAMEQIVAGILASPVPVAVYVTPPGGRAASAGVFIAMAAHISAMAPGTHIGAAHPVDSRGNDITGTMGEKVLNDTLAELRSLSALRGRSPTWAEDAVRRSLSLTETEAVRDRVADLVAPDLGALLAAVDGRSVRTANGEAVIHTAGAEVRRVRMGFIDRLLGFFVNPDIAYILLVIGIFGVIFELTSPGAIAPGVAGALALLMAFLGFGSLPTNIGGVVFIVLAVVLFIVDIKAPTHGILTAGGILAFVLGSLLLFPPWRPSQAPIVPGAPALAEPHISIASIVVMTVLVVGFFVFVLGKGIGALSRRVSFGAESVVGGSAVAVTDIGPSGMVRMAGEQWSARSEGAAIRAGDKVEVTGREGLVLVVRARGSGPDSSRGGVS